MMSKAELIKKFSDYVYYFNAYCTSDAEDHEMLKAVLAMLKEQEDGYKNILSDYEDLAREHEKLLDKKIPLITNGQEVVRCKDCKHYKDDRCFFTMRRHGLHDDWFCADGKRKDS